MQRRLQELKRLVHQMPYLSLTLESQMNELGVDVTHYIVVRSFVDLSCHFINVAVLAEMCIYANIPICRKITRRARASRRRPTPTSKINSCPKMQHTFLLRVLWHICHS